ncbi:MAG: sigma-70 family RNA polymerase sigma factor [Tepidibacter sp.]|jgi:RNA polymerase sigma-70 factor (ECF subfamily)|uniref:sigma-70 family RNA polymerase sigma factor n=1 Tax=Tepidibacter sp. TaxID=2529387 RepID=UPI0025EBF8DE|nr:sigma-70 family RNA polymerase sigma factor [Tepidibacter sp.]MCT4508697.1 sigma-70 family RNA polymerase sigma factor [Tepidibacter sp.]
MIDEKLQQEIHSRNPRTYDFLIKEYSKLLWVIASGILKNVGTREDIEDCVAESFTYLWEHPQKYDQTRGSIKSYLCLITKSKAIDKVRKINKMTTLPYDEDLKVETEDIEKALLNKQMINDIYNFAKDLKEPDSEIFFLRYFYQLKPREIADKLSITSKEVSNRLYYSRKSLLTKIKL